MGSADEVVGASAAGGGADADELEPPLSGDVVGGGDEEGHDVLPHDRVEHEAEGRVVDGVVGLDGHARPADVQLAVLDVGGRHLVLAEEAGAELGRDLVPLALDRPEDLREELVGGLAGVQGRREPELDAHIGVRVDRHLGLARTEQHGAVTSFSVKG